jgi:subtilisin family serine protease
MRKRWLSLGFISFFIISLTFVVSMELQLNRTSDGIIYAGAMNKKTGEKVILKKKFSDLENDKKVFLEGLRKWIKNFISHFKIEKDRRDSYPSYMKRVWRPFRGVDLTYDERILKRFQNGSDFVKVAITIKDNSGVISKKSGQNIDMLTSEKNSLLENKILEVISGFTKEDFNLTTFSRGVVEGEVSRKLFNELLKNPNVESILDHTDVSDKLVPLLDESVFMIDVGKGVWDLGYSGKGINVCIIDSGVDKNHIDLVGKIIYEKCFCSDNGGCCTNGEAESDDATDETGHGTHVAGIIASQDSLYKGVSYGADLYVVKVFGSLGEGGMMGDIGKAVEWCENRGVDIITMSLGDKKEYDSSDCPRNAFLDGDLESAYDSGIFIDAASGNDGYDSGINYPACHKDVVSVGSVYDENVGQKYFNSASCFDSSSYADKIPCYSNTGENLDLLAPGCGITSSAYEGGDKHITYCGTSMSAPHVAGAAALLLEADSSLTPSEIKSALVNNGEDVDGFARIDVLSAINSIIKKEKGQIFNCYVSGYESCAEYKIGNCNVKVALNTYSENDISWGFVNDNSDPYVIKNYFIGWKGIGSKQMYYDVENTNSGGCYPGGCDGTKISSKGIMSVTDSPDTAWMKVLLGYEETPTYYCWVYFDEFEPNYGDDNQVYVLNCFSDDDCSLGEYCDKSGNWQEWKCVVKTDEEPNLIHLFSFQNLTGAVVASFSDDGALNLKGNCFVSDNCILAEDSFILQNPSDETVASISPEGDLCIYKETCSNFNQQICNPVGEAFLVQDDSGRNLSYIDFTGKMCLTGKLRENFYS